MTALFLSHAASDVDLAAYLEGQIRAFATGMDVIRTSRVDQIPPGTEWFNFVTKALRDAARYMVLLTPRSHSRPWVLFETGAAWFTERPLILALAGGLSSASVPEPLRNLQLLSLEDTAEAAQIFTSLGGTLAAPGVFCSQVRSIADVGRIEALKREGWRQMIYKEKTYAWDGPLDRLAEGTPKPVPPGLIEELKSIGLHCQFAIPTNLWNEWSKGLTVIYEIDGLMRKHQLLADFAQVLLVRDSGA